MTIQRTPVLSLSSAARNFRPGRPRPHLGQLPFAGGGRSPPPAPYSSPQVNAVSPAACAWTASVAQGVAGDHAVLVVAEHGLHGLHPLGERLGGPAERGGRRLRRVPGALGRLAGVVQGEVAVGAGPEFQGVADTGRRGARSPCSTARGSAVLGRLGRGGQQRRRRPEQRVEAFQEGQVALAVEYADGPAPRAGAAGHGPDPQPAADGAEEQGARAGRRSGRAAVRSRTSWSRSTPSSAASHFSSSPTGSVTVRSRIFRYVLKALRSRRVATRIWCTESGRSRRTAGSRATTARDLVAQVGQDVVARGPGPCRGLLRGALLLRGRPASGAVSARARASLEADADGRTPALRSRFSTASRKRGVAVVGEFDLDLGPGALCRCRPRAVRPGPRRR